MFRFPRKLFEKTVYSHFYELEGNDLGGKKENFEISCDNSIQVENFEKKVIQWDHDTIPTKMCPILQKRKSSDGTTIQSPRFVVMNRGFSKIMDRKIVLSSDHLPKQFLNMSL